MATKQQSLRLDYLLQASNNLISQCPTLSRFYMQHYQETLRQNDLRAPRTVDRLSCPRCGQIYLAGYNTSVVVTSPSTNRRDDSCTLTTMKKKKRNQKNILVYTCHACLHKRKFHGSFKRHIPATNTRIKAPIAAANTEMPHTKSNPATSTIGTSTTTASKSAPVSAKNNTRDAMKKTTKPSSPVVPSNKRGLPSPSPSPNQQQQQPSKKKSKSSKKNQLQSLLASRKDQNSGGGGGLGLGDFLSSL